MKATCHGKPPVGRGTWGFQIGDERNQILEVKKTSSGDIAFPATPINGEACILCASRLDRLDIISASSQLFLSFFSWHWTSITRSMCSSNNHDALYTEDLDCDGN